MIKNNKTKALFFALGAVIIAAGLFYGGFKFAGLKSAQTEAKPLDVQVTLESPLNADFSLFWDAVSLIKGKYVDIKNVDDQKFLYGAIQGLIGALDDPYSSFMNPSDSKKFDEDLNGSFGGIGAELGIKDKQLIIIAPLKGNPAEKAGLKAGDKIIKVGDKFTGELTVEGAVKLIRGEPGTEVALLISRDGWNEAKEFKIIRQIIIVPTIDSEIKDGNIVYLKLYNFNANVPSLFYESVLSSLLKGVEGMVLDLRNNPGGFLDVATNIAGWFVDRGEIVVKEKLRGDDIRNFVGSGNGALKKMPVVVLVNGGSASAAEILAGALRDNRGVKLVGEKTFGKGTVQEVENLKDGSSIKVSIAEWLTPKGSQINKVGLEPDFEVKISDEDSTNKKDPQLEKALEILKAEMAK